MSDAEENKPQTGGESESDSRSANKASDPADHTSKGGSSFSESSSFEPPLSESQMPLPDMPKVKVPQTTSDTLLKRILSGTVYVAINVIAVCLGPLATAIAMSITGAITCWEFYRIMRADAKLPNQPIGLIFAIALPLISLISPIYMIALIFLMVLVLGIWYVMNLRARITDLAITVFGVIYTSMMLSSIVLIRKAADPGLGGIFLTIGVMASIWAGDSVAYLIGSRFGKHALVPKISPKKSVEGMFGGIFGTLLIWIVISLIPGTGVPIGVAVLAGISCGITGMIGDLVESRIKRGAGIKDSGHIMPGHGGLLDRSDSLLFVGVTAYFILRMTGVL